MHKPLTLKEAAERHGKHVATLRLAIKSGKLKAEKYGMYWFVREAEMDRYVRDAKVGRPGKDKPDGSPQR